MNPDQPFSAVPCNIAKTLAAQGFQPISVSSRDGRYFLKIQRFSASY